MSETWECDAIQFPRLLAEIYAAGLTAAQEEALVASMDISRERLYDLLERADARWEKVKAVTVIGKKTDGALVTCPKVASDVLGHVGHKIACVYYGTSKEDAYNAAIECETCGVVLLDIDRSLEANGE